MKGNQTFEYMAVQHSLKPASKVDTQSHERESNLWRHGCSTFSHSILFVKSRCLVRSSHLTPSHGADLFILTICLLLLFFIEVSPRVIQWTGLSILLRYVSDKGRFPIWFYTLAPKLFFFPLSLLLLRKSAKFLKLKNWVILIYWFYYIIDTRFVEPHRVRVPYDYG
jgi:hypothetical protein